ncbi:MAG: flagellar motor switch protein FliG, partial [Chlorobia bacterium]|nr:flagellar motor switch protein FliG [Fimbriimonadaceae bacterium]
MRKRQEELSMRQKAAIMLMVLGPQSSGNVVRHLDEDQIEVLSLELARLDKVTPEQREGVIREFYEVAIAQDYIAEGGVEHARRVLEEAFGNDRAEEVIK